MEKAALKMRVAIIGQGYVGLTIAASAAAHHEVIGFDNNKELIIELNKGISHIEGVDSEVLKKWISVKKYRATQNCEDIAGSDVIVIAVPTPLDANRQPDLSFIKSACKTIGENLSTSALIINESTSFPGTVRNLIKPLIEKYSKIKAEHLYAISPERVDPGRTDWNQKNTPRLYAGLTPAATKATKEFYSTFCDNLIEVTSPEIAEAAKLFENTFRQVNIALVNEFAQSANAIGIDVREVLAAADSKPYGFMKFSPGAGVGGHCIPVDPSYLAYLSAQNGVRATFIERANEVNLAMPRYIVSRITKDNGGNLQGKKVLVIGVAYKSNVADTRETPAELLIDELKKQGAIVTWNDPLVKAWKGESSAPLIGADIAIVATKHDVVPVDSILKAAPYVFDTTGKVAGASHL